MPAARARIRCWNNAEHDVLPSLCRYFGRRLREPAAAFFRRPGAGGISPSYASGLLPFRWVPVAPPEKQRPTDRALRRFHPVGLPFGSGRGFGAISPPGGSNHARGLEVPPPTVGPVDRRI